MSWETEQWARKQRVGDPVRKAVLVAIANEADTSGCNAFPSVGFIAHDVEVSERTVQRRLQELEDMGFIKRVTRYRPDGSQSSNGFDLVGYAPPSEWKDRPRRARRTGGDNLTPLPPVKLSPPGDAGVTPPGDTAVTPKTSDELPFPPAVGDKSPPAPPGGGPAAGKDEPNGKRKKAHRLPDDWQAPPSEVLPLALQSIVRTWPPGAYEFVAARFAAHWLTTPGAKASKLDWERAWHNWLPGDARTVMQLKRDGVDFAAEARRAAGTSEAVESAAAALEQMQQAESADATAIRDSLRADVGPRTYDGWFKPTVMAIEDETLTLTVASAFMRDWIDSHLAERLLLHARARLGRDVCISIVKADL